MLFIKQASILEASYVDVSDIYDIGGSRGLFPHHIENIPKFIFQCNKTMDPCKEINCTICLQVIILTLWRTYWTHIKIVFLAIFSSFFLFLSSCLLGVCGRLRREWKPGPKRKHHISLFELRGETYQHWVKYAFIIYR